MRFFPPGRASLAAALSLVFGACLATPSSSSQRAAALVMQTTAAPHAARPARLPLDFVENKGQWRASIEFSARSGPIAPSFTRRSVRLWLRKGRSSVPLLLRFDGASDAVRLVGIGRRSATYNFFVGDDPSRWRANVRAFS